VLSVRPLTPQGVGRLWPKPARIEVTAGLPDSTAPIVVPPPSSGVVQTNHSTTTPTAAHWQSVAWLQAMGLLSAYAELLQQHLSARHLAAPRSLEDEWALVSEALGSFWVEPPSLDDGLTPRPHVFVGPPGCGKTTVLCKWLTLAVLTEERAARVWRLDGSSANTAEFLTIHCEILGVPVERFWSPPQDPSGLQLIDLPGVEADDAQALAVLRGQLGSLPRPRVHLVLNAAYETSTLFDQWRAFSALEPDDVTFTHLDEETRRVKLWNFVFANCGLRFLSAGQKIPGGFHSAAPEFLFPLNVPR
jgi:flagellar biosynthesis GTPase FlhF